MYQCFGGTSCFFCPVDTGRWILGNTNTYLLWYMASPAGSHSEYSLLWELKLSVQENILLWKVLNKWIFYLHLAYYIRECLVVELIYVTFKVGFFIY
jgi:hypothetical protein